MDTERYLDEYFDKCKYNNMQYFLFEYGYSNTVTKLINV